MERKWAWAIGGVLATAATWSATIAYYGWNVLGLEIGARTTARCSALMLAAAVAWRLLHIGRAALWSFVGAHATHYVALIAFAWMDATHPLHSLARRAAAAAVLGTLLVVMIAWTADSSLDWKRKLNSIFVYWAWALFFIASSSRFQRHAASAVVTVALVVAMAARMASERMKAFSAAV